MVVHFANFLDFHNQHMYLHETLILTSESFGSYNVYVIISIVIIIHIPVLNKTCNITTDKHLYAIY